MPRLIIAGTVMRDVLPVTTLSTLVKKKTAMRIYRCVWGMDNVEYHNLRVFA
jgi:hypothetical protein